MEAAEPRGDQGTHAGWARLFVCSGPDTGSTVHITRDETTLGRSSECHIRVSDGRASSTHARIERSDGTHRIRDLGSTNGTFVNNRRVEEVQLRSGDMIQVGETLFEFNEDSDAERAYVESQENSMALYFPRQYDAGYDQPQAPYGYMPPSGPPPTAATDDDGPPIDWIALAKRWGKIAKMYVPYWWIAVIGLVLGIAWGIVAFQIWPPARVASFTVQLNQKQATVQPGYGPPEDFYFREAEQNFLSSRLVRQTLEDVGLTGDGDSEGFVKVIREVLLEFQSVGGRGSNTYKGSFMLQDEELALQFLKTHLDNYIESEIEKALNKQLAEEAFFTKEVAEARDALELADNELAAFKSKHIEAQPGQAEGVYLKLVELRERKRTLEKQLEQDRLELGIVENTLRRTPKIIVSGEGTTNPYAERVAGLTAELANAKASGLGPNHPTVKRLQAELAEVQQLARREGYTTASKTSNRNPVYAAAEERRYQLRASIARAEKELDQVTNEIDESSHVAGELPELEARYTALVDRYEVAKKEFAYMQEKLRSAERQVELDRTTAAAKYDLINPPELEYLNEKDALRKKAIISGAGGLILSLLVITVVLLRRKTLTLEMLFTIPRVARA
ncbi:MAG: FHA domain-containing protein [Myxococcota bacterium]